MTTNNGIELTEKEVKLIKQLEAVARRWKKDGGDLWLYSASGTLCVMLNGDTKRNPTPEFKGDSPNSNNVVTSINIPNDGGDW